MKYGLFLFDLDDTLLDFRESERLCFKRCMHDFGVEQQKIEKIFKDYQLFNDELWRLFEKNETTKDELKVERFRRTFAHNKLDINPEMASQRYLDALPSSVVLMDGAVEICEWLKQFGQIGVITNGIQSVQHQRIENSPLNKAFDFVCVSEECGHAKPDVRFFEYTASFAKNFRKEKTIVIGDRFDADIVGANNFGVDSCWFNPHQKESGQTLTPTFEIQKLRQLKELLN